MYTLRKYLSWTFAFISVVCLEITFSIGLRPVYEHKRLRIVYLLVPALFTTFSIVFAAAWWSVFREKSSARAWGIAASLINILVALTPVAFPPHSIWNGFLLLLALGMAGLITFCCPVKLPNLAATKEYRAIPGDGTSKLLNKATQPVMLLVMIGGYEWWISWLNIKGIVLTQGTFCLVLVAILIA